MKLLNSFWFVDVGRLLYNGPTISHFFINSRIKRWIDWKKWKRLMGGPLKKVSELMEWNDKRVEQREQSTWRQWNGVNERGTKQQQLRGKLFNPLHFSSPAARDEEMEWNWKERASAPALELNSQSTNQFHQINWKLIDDWCWLIHSALLL